MKRKLLIISIICGLLAQSMTAFAADDEAKIKAQLLKNLDAAPVSQCQDALVPLFDLELNDFLKFLDQSFQNKSSSGSLTNISIARYRDYKRTLNDIFARLDVNDPKNQDVATANAAYALCSNLLTVYFSAAKKMLIDHVKQTAAVKSTSALLDKYQAINSKLRDLNLAISQLYGYFAAFKNLLPGFVKNCLKSG